MFHEYSSTVMRKRPPQGVTIPELRKGKLPIRALARRSRLNRELTQERARRRNWRRMLDFRGGKIAKCVLEQSARRYQFDHARDADDIDLWPRGLYVGLFF